MRTESLMTVVLPLAFASPWIIGSIVYWLKRPKDGHTVPSWAELAYRR
jgi:hypothetical protein